MISVLAKFTCIGDDYVRILEFANAPELLALYTTRIVWVALDLLLSASDASDGQPFPWFPSFRDAPMCINNLSIDYCLAVCSIVVEITRSFAWYFCLPNKSRQELGAGPYLWSKSIFGH